MTFRAHLDSLATANELLRIEERLVWDAEVEHVAAEAARSNCPAVLFEEQPGEVRLASGMYAGPSRTQPRKRTPWSRLAMALGGWSECEYAELLSTLRIPNTPEEHSAAPDQEKLLATSSETDLYSLGFPRLGTCDGAPSVTLGVLAFETTGKTTWAPVRGTVVAENRIRMTIPQAACASLSTGDAMTLAAGTPPAVLLASRLQWVQELPDVDTPALAAAVGDDTPTCTTSTGAQVPTSAEVVIRGEVASTDAAVPGPAASWEHFIPTATVELVTADVLLRDDPVVPFTPLDMPMVDDLHLTGTVAAARLLQRVNTYWPVEPVKWVDLPAEAGLGICVVSSLTLYPGFEWQLANLVFNLSQLFDKVLILNEDTMPRNLGRVFDDIWVKADPAHDWKFSEPEAPAATIPPYREGVQTGQRLYINATWDPTWEKEAIAPRVTFESSYPESIQQAVFEYWSEYGFRSSPPEWE